MHMELHLPKRRQQGVCIQAETDTEESTDAG